MRESLLLLSIGFYEFLRVNEISLRLSLTSVSFLEDSFTAFLSKALNMFSFLEDVS